MIRREFHVIFLYFQVHNVFQQTGFRRVKRGYKPFPVNEVMEDLLSGPRSVEKKNAWSDLRASLDLDNINPAVVHPEDYFDKLNGLTSSADKEKRGYNSLKVFIILYLTRFSRSEALSGRDNIL